MNHPKHIVKYTGSLTELGEDICSLGYLTLAELFAILVEKFTKDSAHDLELNHPKVSKHLHNIATALQDILTNDIRPKVHTSVHHDLYMPKYSGSLLELGEDIGDLDYDTLAELFLILTSKSESPLADGLQKLLESDILPLADRCRAYNQRGQR